MSELQQTGTGGVAAPPVLYLPVDLDAEGQISEFKMIKLGDGRVALLGYTALDRFVDSWGEHQPWVLFQTDRIDEIKRAKHFDLKLLDVDMPAQFRPTGPVVGR